MPVICCSTTSVGRFGARAAIENVRSVGLDSIELTIGTAGAESPSGDEPLLTTATPERELLQIESLLADNGVRVASCNLAGENPLDPDELVSIHCKLDLARRLGVQTVVGPGGAAGTNAEREQLYAHLREIGDHSARLGIVYCCDTLPGICMDHRRMFRGITEINHSHIRLNFDTGNLVYYNESPVVEVALAKVCHLVRHVRLKDSQGESGVWHFPALGYGGAVNFMRVYQLMRDCGFRGPYSIAVDGIAGEDPTLEEHLRRLVDSLRTLRECGYFDRDRELWQS